MIRLKRKAGAGFFLHSMPAFLFISLFSIWYISAGLFPHFPAVDNEYNDLAEAFLRGQAHLLEAPNPQLMELQDPYDASQRTVPYRWDATYFNGKYYLYWGPVPAVVMALAWALTGSPLPGWLPAWFALLAAGLFLWAILLKLQTQFFPESPAFSSGLFLLLGCFNLPMLFLLGRPIIYETSIAFGQMFLLAGLYAWLAAYLSDHHPGAYFAAGLCWGLAVCSRYNLLLAACVFLGFSYWALQSTPGKLNRKMALTLPFLACLAALGYYNAIRFGNPLESGFRYQLSIPEVQGVSYSAEYIPSNLFAYLAYPQLTSARFPFVISTLPAGRPVDEVTAGLFASLPGVWLLPIGLLINFRLGLRREPAPTTANVRLVILMIAMACSIQFLFLLGFFFSAMRYVADFLPLMMVCIAALFWRADSLLPVKRYTRFLLWFAVSVFTAWTALLAFFGSFDIPPRMFAEANPALYASLAAFWNSLIMR